MQRRTFLRAAAGVGTAAGLAGCSGLPSMGSGLSSPGGSSVQTPTGEEVAGRVYYPTHVDGMQMAGMGRAGDYQFGVMFTWPHEFWTVTGGEKSRVSIEDGDSMHLMASVWHPETNTVLPDTGLSMEVLQDGETVSEEVIYPMLSQPMGFHYGGNFGVPGDGTYTARVSVGAMSTRRTGEFADVFDEPATAEIEFEFGRSILDDLMYNELVNAGEPGATSPMEMNMMPNSVAPPGEALAFEGTVLGEATSSDCNFVAVSYDVDRFPGENSYLAVSARTPYNRMVLPAMGLSATLTRDGSTVFDGPLEPTLDPEVNYHYGAAVESVESGDELTLSVGTPPQVARHQGYEKAFLDMPDVTIRV